MKVSSIQQEFVRPLTRERLQRAMQFLGINIILFNVENGFSIRSILSVERGSGGGQRSHRRKSNRKTKEDGEIVNAIVGIVGLYFISLAITFHYNRAEFWRLLIWGALVATIILVLALALIKLVNFYHERRLNKLINKLITINSEGELKNFINIYCKKFTRGSAWKYKNFRIDWVHFNALQKYLANKGLVLDDSRMSTLLQHYIREREYVLMTANIGERRKASNYE